VLNGKLSGQLKIVLTIQDLEKTLPGTNEAQTYTGAFVEVIHPRHYGRINEVHGMIGVERWPEATGAQRRVLGSTRLYPMSTKLRSVHLIPASLKDDEIFFINNYLDWDSINEIYDLECEQKASRAALKFQSSRQI
jgi:hypothetical protein